MSTFACLDHNLEFNSAEEVVNHIAATHAAHIPLHEREKWFGTDEEKPQLITEYVPESSF